MIYESDDFLNDRQNEKGACELTMDPALSDKGFTALYLGDLKVAKVYKKGREYHQFQRWFDTADEAQGWVDIQSPSFYMFS